MTASSGFNAELLALLCSCADTRLPSSVSRSGPTVRQSRKVQLFGIVWGEDGRWLADHLWVRQTWNHLRPGDAVEFCATVVPYRRQDGTESFTLSEVNGLIRLGPDNAAEEN
jgi:hypothetical protein